MRTIATLLASLLVLAPAAVAQNPALGFSAPGAGQNNWNDEPNVAAGSCLPYGHGDPAACYPADANGVAGGRAGVETLVLQAKLNPYYWPVTTAAGTYSGLGLAGVPNFDANVLFDAFSANDYMLPGSYGINVFHGYWQDINGDGFRDDQGHWRNSVDGHDRQVYVNADGNKACTQEDPSVDPAGSTRLAGGHEGNLIEAVDVPVGVSYRCTTPDEWRVVDGWSESPPEVVGYLSPSEYTASTVSTGATPTLRSPCPVVGLETHEDCVDDSGQRTPDAAFTPGDFYGDGTYSWDLVYVASLDGSLLETRALTVISNPVVSSDGPMSKIAGDASLVDVDLFASVDPLAEALYQQAVFAVAAPAADGVLDPVSDAYEATVCPALEGVCGINVAGGTDAVTGPQRAKFFRPEADLPDGRVAEDYVTPHLYLNLHVAESFHAGLQLTAYSGSNWGIVDLADGDTQDTAQYCPDLTGDHCGAPVRIQVDGFFGIWEDVNGDGFVGNPAVSEGCPDAYNCGATQDPNEDLWGFEATDEWTPLCLDTKSGHNFVTLWTDSGAWGPVGAYVTHDDESDLDSTQGARAQFDPYDDAYNDVLADGDVDYLVTSGPIELLVVCVDENGQYYSWQEVIVPGLQATTGIHLKTDAFTLGVETGGVPADETVTDTDYEGAWQFA